jgi:hypothetical protein
MKKKYDEDFYMILPSNSCPTTQPENIASKYIVDWETAIKLEGKWKVALTEFSFIYYDNITHDNAIISYKTSTPLVEAVSILYNGSKNFLTYSVKDNESGEVLNPTYKVVYLNAAGKIEVTCNHTPWTLFFRSKREAEVMGFQKIEYKVDTKTITAELVPLHSEVLATLLTSTFIKNNIVIEESLNFTDSDLLAEFLEKRCSHIFESVSIVNGNVVIKKKKDITEVMFNQYMGDILGLEGLMFTGYVTIKGKSKPKVIDKSIQIYIYSSIVNPIHVGGALVPLLKSLWIESKYKNGEAVNEIIDNPMYLPLSCTTINNIEINIRNDIGKLAKFPKGTKSSLTLHFQKYE